MAIKEITRFQTSDGKLYETETEALEIQSSIDKANIKNETNQFYIEFLKKSAGLKNTGELYNGVLSDKFGLGDSKEVLTKIILDYQNSSIETTLKNIIDLKSK